MLSSQAAPALPGAALYIQRATDYLTRQGTEKLQEALGSAAASTLGLTGTVLVNASKLPGLILPNAGSPTIQSAIMCWA